MKVDDIRTAKGVSVFALARGIGLSRTRTNAMLQQHGASWDNVTKIAAVLGVQPEDIAERATFRERPLMEYGKWRE